MLCLVARPRRSDKLDSLFLPANYRHVKVFRVAAQAIDTLMSGDVYSIAKDHFDTSRLEVLRQGFLDLVPLIIFKESVALAKAGAILFVDKVCAGTAVIASFNRFHFRAWKSPKVICLQLIVLIIEGRAIQHGLST